MLQGKIDDHVKLVDLYKEGTRNCTIVLTLSETYNILTIHLTRGAIHGIR